MADEEPLAGKKDQVAGKAKELGGKVSGDDKLEAEGKGQHAGGKVHEKVHDAGETVKGLANKLKRRKDA